MVVGAGVVETPSVVVASGVVVMASVVSTVVISAKNTRESRCLAGEPKHFPFAIVFV